MTKILSQQIMKKSQRRITYKLSQKNKMRKNHNDKNLITTNYEKITKTNNL